ncbi:MAG: hypothetical protein V4541_15615 [Bacteroidota bacterium]
MDVISYLLELIATQKMVGIAGLGTFYKKKIPGRYDSESHSFLPPRYKLEFTAELKEQEVLASFISQKRNISLSSSNHFINEFAENTQSQLADKQQSDLSSLGVLKIINDEIVFEPASDLETGFDFYGLPPVSENAARIINKPPTDNNVVEQELSAVEDENTPVIKDDLPLPEPIKWKPSYEYDDDDDDDENTGRGKRIFLKTLLVLLIIAIGGAVVYFVFPDFYDSVRQRFETPKQIDQQAVTIDFNRQQLDSARLADSIAKASIVLSLPKDTSSIDTLQNQLTYEVIGSAMKSQAKVDQVIANLAKRGILAKKMNALPGRLIKISLGTFTDYQLAKKYQDSLKIKLKNPEIYIQTIKPQK